MTADARQGAPSIETGPDTRAAAAASDPTRPGEINCLAELRALAQLIERAKGELSAILPRGIARHRIPVATDQLQAVVEATAVATDEILACAEQLLEMEASSCPEPPAPGAPTPDAKAPGAKALGALATRLFEACNFQDLTGQRIAKVVATLKHIEGSIDRLIQELDQATGPGLSADQLTLASGDPPPDVSALEGPQLSGAANTQGDIDRIFQRLA